MVNRGEDKTVTSLLCGLPVLLIVCNMFYYHRVLQILPTREESISLGGPLILLIAKDQFKDSVLKYDRYQGIKTIHSEMNRNPWLWKLSPITFLRARLLKIQKKRKHGHHGGK